MPTHRQELELGKRIGRMVADVAAAAATEAGSTAYAIQRLTYPGGHVDVIVAMPAVSKAIELALTRLFEVADKTPKSEVN